MRPRDLNITLFDAGVQTTIDSVVTPLVALADAAALERLVHHLVVVLMQSGSLGLVLNDEAVQAFILHAQRTGDIDVEFLTDSFVGTVRNGVPVHPPVAPVGLWISESAGVVTSSSDLGTDCDRYELQYSADGSTWATVAVGTTREDGVDYPQQSPGAGTHWYRVIARYGSYPSFPGDAVSVEVGG